MQIDPEREHWLRRLDATGKAQARYLWLVLIAALFYLALQAAGPQSEQITVPVVNLKLDPGSVQASGGPILAFLVLAVMGAIRAWTHALEQYRGAPAPKDAEQLDTYPNALDLAMYTTHESPAIIRNVLYFVYPLYLTAALAESLWLEAWLWSFPMTPGRTFFLIAWVPIWGSAAILVLAMWGKRIKRLWTKGRAG